jgi:lipopolysaccharide heptosyltransferase II
MFPAVIKCIDRLAGSILVSLIVKKKPVKGGPVRSILLIRPGGIGDAVLLAPAINSLKKIYPDCHITILAEQRNADVFSLLPGIEKVLCYDRPNEFIQALRGRYDVMVDTEQWYRLSAVVARLVRAPVKIGFDTNDRRRMFTHSIPYDLNAYEPDNFLALLNPLGVDSQRDPETVSLSLPPQSVSRAGQWLQTLNSDPFVVIFPGSSIPEKCWGTERFIQVSRQIAGYGFKTVVVGGRKDRADGNVIAGAGGLNLAGMTTLAESAAVIARSGLVVSGDSGVLHLAAGQDVPTVSLFGPSSVAKWAPRGDKHIVLSKKLSCSPCSKFGTTPPCTIEARCMRDITVDEVVNAVTMLLTSLGAMPSQCCKRDWIEVS